MDDVAETNAYLLSKGKTKIAAVLLEQELSGNDILDAEIDDLVPDIFPNKLQAKGILKLLRKYDQATPPSQPGEYRMEGQPPRTGRSSTMDSGVPRRRETSRVDEQRGEPDDLSLGRILATVGRQTDSGQYVELQPAPCKAKEVQCFYLPVKRIGPIDEVNKVIHYRTELPSRFGTDPHSSKIEEKTILVVGETGAGKSTLINGLINYMLGVQFSDDCRFKLIREDETVNKEAFKLSEKKRQTMSQTDYATVYKIGCYDGMRCNFRLTVIDTPGFGDTRGIPRDQKIVKDIGNMIDNRAKFGLDHLNYIAFVLPANQGRLTATMRYISQSILAMFGKDLFDSILPCLTFSDGGDSNALAALEEGKVPFKEHCLFQNSAIYQKTKSEPRRIRMQGLYWDIGNDNFEKMVELCGGKEAVPLKMTCDVVKQKRLIDANTYHVETLMTVVRFKRNELAAKQKALMDIQKEIEQGKKLRKVEIPCTIVKRNQCPPGKYVTNCSKCKQTCHHYCSLNPSESKRYCGAMSGGNCTHCKNKCHYSDHVNASVFFTHAASTKWVDCQEMIDQYAKGLKGKAAFEATIQGLENDINEAVDMQTVCVNRLTQNHNRLKEIAMRPDPLSDTAYLDSLIKLEEMNKSEEGWEDRRKNLQEIKANILRQQKVIDDARQNIDQHTKGKERTTNPSMFQLTIEAIAEKIRSWSAAWSS